jgi:hypothetical protein
MRVSPEVEPRLYPRMEKLSWPVRQTTAAAVRQSDYQIAWTYANDDRDRGVPEFL